MSISSRRNSIKIFLFGFASGIVFISTFLNAYVGIFYNLNCITRITSDDIPSSSMVADFLFGRSGNHSTAVDIATPSLAVVSACIPGERFPPEYINMSHTNKLRYCERYHAKCILPTARVGGNSKVHKKWDKLHYIKHTLDTQEVDWVLWMDCDAAFTNYEINWYTHLKTYLNTSQLMVVATDFNGINLGVFLVPNTQVSRTLIEDMYKQRFAIDKDRKFLFKDQSALKQLIKKNSSIESSIEIVPSKLMNTYPNAWVPNDWIMHQVNCIDLRNCLANFKRVMKMVTPPYSPDHGNGIMKEQQNTKMAKKETLILLRG